MRGVPVLAVVVAMAALFLAASGSPRGVKEGGTFRIGIPTEILDSIDPILYEFPGAEVPLRATCAGLLRYLDLPYPDGLRLVPEIAVAYPRISPDGKTYTFTIRKGLRFSTGAPVTARSFVRTINRFLNPTMKSPYATNLKDIVGAQDVIDGKAETVSGVLARGSTLTIRLTKPVADFTPTAGGLCVVPESMPIDPEGAKAPVPGAGPYYISEYVPGQRLVLDRNRYYDGHRPHHVNRVVIDVGSGAASLLDRVDRGELDYAYLASETFGDRVEEFQRKYGVNKTRFFTAPALNLRIFVLNTSGPLFRHNPKLRQAVNFAVDRKAILRESGGPLSGYLTDQYLPPFAPGFRNDRIYPLKGPDLKKARALAKGHTRSGKAVLYTCASSQCLAAAQVLQQNLKPIGLDVEIKASPSQVYFPKLATPGEPFDIGRVGWISIGWPADTILNAMFDGRTIANAPDFANLSYFNSPKYNRLLDQAARLPYGPERERAYAALDVDLAKNAAPAIPLSYDRLLTLVSARTGCVVLNPYLDLAAVCLK